MNFNLTVIISLLISCIISYNLGYYSSLVFITEKNSLFKLLHLAITIISFIMIYSPIKFFLLKFMDFNIKDKKNEDN